MNKRARLLSLLLVAAMTLSAVMIGGCAGGTEAGGGDAEPETLKIGVHTSLTGQLARYGEAAKLALELTAKDLDDVEIDERTYRVELVIKDDKGEEAEASVVAQALVDEGVAGVIGALGSGTTNAALPIYRSAGIPVISGSATNPDITDTGGFENFFRTCLRDDLQGKAIAEWVVELGAKKAVVQDAKDDYSVGLGNAVQANLKASGVTVQREAAEKDTTDFSAQIANIKEFAPDIIVFTGYQGDGGLLRKQLVDAGLKDTTFLGGDGIKSDEVVAESGGSANAKGMLCTFGSLSADQMPGYADFAAEFKAANGEDAGPYAENNADALGVLVAAMTEAGSTDGDAVIQALGSIEFAGIIGSFGFDEKGDIAVKGASGTAAIPRFENDGTTWRYIQR